MKHSDTIPSYRIMAQGRHFHLGVLAAIATICIWASWLLSLKFAVQSQLTLFDLAIMRYGFPGLAFGYVTYQSRQQIRQVPLRLLLGIFAGAGVPFFYLASQGMAHAPVTHSGLLITGALPLFVTSIAVLVYKEPLSRSRLSGLSAIGIGIGVLLSSSLLTMQVDVLIGDIYFLAASFSWAMFTICLRVSGLSPFAAIGLLGVVSSAILFVLFAVGVFESSLSSLLWYEESTAEQSANALLVVWLFQFFVQALIVGVFAGISYVVAIRRIGAEATAAIGSLTPVLAALGAYCFLSESLLLTDVIAMLLVFVGVILASEIIQGTHLTKLLKSAAHNLSEK